MSSTYAPVIAALDNTQKAHFYLLLARELTIAQRGVWADELLDVSEQVDRLKWFNEIMHRVLNRLYGLQQATEAGNEDELWATITDHAMQNQPIVGDLAWAVREAYKTTTQRDLPM
jgi:hypothetical protein